MQEQTHLYRILRIFNLLGKKVYSQVINSSKIVLNLKLQSGMYFLNVSDAKGQMRAKRMIIHEQL